MIGTEKTKRSSNKTSSRKTKTASKLKTIKDNDTIVGSSCAKVDELCLVRGGSN